MSMGDAWRLAFNDRVARVHQGAVHRIGVVGSRALTLNSHDAGSVETWVQLFASHPHWQAAAIKEPEWTVPTQIIQDNLSDVDCVMTQQMLQARASKNEGDAVKMPTKVVGGQNE